MTQEYVKIYCKALGYDAKDPTFFVPSEISGERAVDVHHIINREDRIENMMAVTRKEHQDYGEIKDLKVLLLKIHRRFLQINNVTFDNKWFEFYINKYG